MRGNTRLIKAITLDLGCTLVLETSCMGEAPSNVTLEYAKSLANFLRELGYEVSPEDVVDLEDSWRGFIDKYYDSSVEVSLELKLHYVLSRLGVAPKPVIVESALRRVVDALAKTRVIYDDVNGFVDEAKRLGFKVAVISNTNSHQGYVETLRRAGLLNKLDLLVTSHIVVYKKPAEEIFRIAAELLGLDPGQIIHVGDSIVDVSGALSAGYAEAIELARHKECVTRKCFKNLKEVLGYIKKKYPCTVGRVSP